MDREDIIDLLSIVAANDRRTIGEMDIGVWYSMISRFTKDDCAEAIMAHFRDQPGVWLTPGHVVTRLKAMIRDRLDRMDPDERAAAAGNPLVRRDSYGYIDKSETDEPPYPPEWTPQQCLKATWERLQEYRDVQEYEQAAAHPGMLLPKPPGSAATRAAALAVFAARQGRLDTADDEQVDEEAAPYVNVLLVACDYCGAPVSEQCIRAGMPGQGLEKLEGILGHPSRIVKAAVAAGHSDSRALEIAGMWEHRQVRRSAARLNRVES